MKAQIAFYKAPGDLIDKTIRFWTRSKYSHCELVIDNRWYSSSPRDSGFRIKEIIPDAESWDFYDIELSKESLERLQIVSEKYKGSGYDFLGIFLCQFMKFKSEKSQSNTKVTCSEVIAEILGFSKTWTYSPQTLLNQLEKLSFNN